MNNLSWFLYLADVLPTIAGTFGLIGIMVGLIGGAFGSSHGL